MIDWTDEQLAERKIDRARLEALVSKLNECLQEMRALRLEGYVASGAVHLMCGPSHDGAGTAHQERVVATLDDRTRFDGGDW